MVEAKDFQGLKVFESPASEGAPTIVLLHGYGANGQDLVPCADLFKDAHAYRWLFPEAPIELDGRARYASRAWFEIDVSRFGQAAVNGTDLVLDPRTLKEAEMQAERLAEIISQDVRPDPARTFVGGFSQGSMLALLVAAKLDLPWAGLLLFSCAAVYPETMWSESFAKLKHKPDVFLSHGRYDPVLGYASSRRLRAQMAANGFAVTNCDFDGGHELPSPVLAAADRFVQKRLRGPTTLLA